MFKLSQGAPVIFLYRSGTDIDDEEDLLFVIIKGNELVKKHKIHVLKTFLVKGIQIEAGFAVLDVVVGKVTHQTAGKGRQPRQRGASVVIENLLDVGTGIPCFETQGSTVPDLDYSVGTGNFQPGVVTDEGIASPAPRIFKAFKDKTLAAQVFKR
jgi:hypothetical protein